MTKTIQVSNHEVSYLMEYLRRDWDTLVDVLKNDIEDMTYEQKQKILHDVEANMELRQKLKSNPGQFKRIEPNVWMASEV